MKCPFCRTEIDIRKDMTVQEAEHDHQKLDIVITCPECKVVYNAFVDISDDFMTLD